MLKEGYKYTEYGLDRAEYMVARENVLESWEEKGIVYKKDLKKLLKLAYRLMTRNYPTYRTIEY